MEKQIDILIMGDNNLDSVGGEQESTKIIIDSIQNLYKVGVIQPGVMNEKYKNVKYFHLTEQKRIKHIIKRPFAFFRYVNSIKKIVKDYEPKIIHTQAQISFFVIGLLIKLKMISPNIIFIHTERGLLRKYNLFFQNLFFFFMKELDTLITTTHYNHKQWKEALFEKRIDLKHEIIENTAGIYFETYDTSIKNEQPEIIKIGFAGRYTNWKNWPLAEEIVHKLYEKTNGNIEVKIAMGCLDKKSIKETNKLYQRLERLLLERFEGKININLKEMDKFYYEIDFFVLTSNKDTESFGRTLVEAMSRNNIVLTTNSGGSVEVVGEERNVFDNAEDFSNRIIELFENKEEFYEEKERNFDRVHSKYSLENNKRKHIDLYQKKLIR